MLGELLNVRRFHATLIEELDSQADAEKEIRAYDFAIGTNVVELTNTLRHSGATRSFVRVWRDEEGAHLEIHDDGASGEKLVEGHGLKGMRERLERLKGSLHIDNVDDALRLNVVIPLTS